MQPHVLVVEDEDALSELLQYNLKKEGFRVSVAADGEEALMLVPAPAQPPGKPQSADHHAHRAR